MRVWEIMGGAWLRFLEGVATLEPEFEKLNGTIKSPNVVHRTTLAGKTVKLPKSVADRLDHLNAVMQNCRPVDVTDLSDDETIRLILGK